jgi:hypothetical protein
MFEPNYHITKKRITLNNQICKAVGVCIITNTPYETSEFLLSSWKEWQENNIPIQNTQLGHLSADDREFLITGISPQGFNNIYNN